MPGQKRGGDRLQDVGDLAQPLAAAKQGLDFLAGFMQKRGAVDFQATFIWKTVEKAGKRWKGKIDQRPGASSYNLLNY